MSKNLLKIKRRCAPARQASQSTPKRSKRSAISLVGRIHLNHLFQKPKASLQLPSNTILTIDFIRAISSASSLASHRWMRARPTRTARNVGGTAPREDCGCVWSSHPERTGWVGVSKVGCRAHSIWPRWMRARRRGRCATSKGPLSAGSVDGRAHRLLSGRGW